MAIRSLKGVHPKGNKERTSGSPVVELPVHEGELFYLSLVQHLGAPAKALVKKGDTVVAGQLIAQATSFISANIHSPVDGVVTAIEYVCYPVVSRAEAIVIKATAQTGQQAKIEGETVVELVKNAGIVGLGGAMFPTHVKLSPPKPLDILIINGAECEPYLTCDHRMMLEKADELMKGAEIIKKALNIKRVIFAVESNKPDAIQLLEKKCKDYNFELFTLPEIYPQGGEKQIIQTVLGIEVPEGKLPSELSVLVQNVSTVFAVYEAIEHKKPLTKRVLTVTGNVKNPMNILAPLGTPIRRLVDFCGGFVGGADRIILGGPMTGFAAHNMDIPVYKGMNGIIIFNQNSSKPTQRNCIRCGACVRACPMGLSPVMLEMLASKNMYDGLEQWKLLSCIECSACNFVCPSGRDLKTAFKPAKKPLLDIIASRKKNA